MTAQFKDMLYCLTSSISAGRSLENSFINCSKDLMTIYDDPNTPIILEAELIKIKMQINEPVEIAVEDFAKRANIPDIINFCDILKIIKKTGGNMPHLLKTTINFISQKIDSENEINTIISGKKFEQKIMNFMPLGIIGFLAVSSGNYIEPLYTEPFGKIIMLFALCLYFLSIKLSNKLCKIRI